MMEYNLINPSDPYTFLAEDFETAAIVVMLAGGTYGAKAKEGGDEVPLFFLGGREYALSWYDEHFHRTPQEGYEAKKSAVADALLSMMFGGFEDRRRYEAALSAITDDEKRKEFVASWQDGISSLNDIGTWAHNLGAKIKEGLK